MHPKWLLALETPARQERERHREMANECMKSINDDGYGRWKWAARVRGREGKTQKSSESYRSSSPSRLSTLVVRGEQSAECARSINAKVPQKRRGWMRERKRERKSEFNNGYCFRNHAVCNRTNKIEKRRARERKRGPCSEKKSVDDGKQSQRCGQLWIGNIRLHPLIVSIRQMVAPCHVSPFYRLRLYTIMFIEKLTYGDWL